MLLSCLVETSEWNIDYAQIKELDQGRTRRIWW